MVDKVYGHAEVLSVVVPITYADLTTAVAEAAAQLPAYAEVIGGNVTIDTAFDYGTSGVADIGDTADPDRYSSTPIDLTTAASTALTLTGFKQLAPTDILVTPTLVGAVTEGEGRLTILYTVEGRATQVAN